MPKSYFNSSDVYMVSNVAVSEKDLGNPGLFQMQKVGPPRVMRLPNSITRIYIDKDPEVPGSEKE